ncbi:BglG family transcription antiterminator LicT [Bacillus glycinifermentans]|uniref:PRD domain-containing protein n=1 Tax=Bacillus glycinifermentans TaxID=1664069 RepID=A0A0T6BKT9_9BACI|nr:PRD domain-containing protein [Bacillus glycinifermentans]ATH93790.1 transcription antiterminator LicT [Bacillus glycinifermentans]KRT90032.1 transcription antiterminator LicT [Bacillus glycinifermentans]MEC0483711.1 PRD domain-containing protein [Bacillus glycinifermentans]MEC0496206.1 PRD domain-containing protein [Bacillus glycinifermentans]MEC0539484.1 PRD domain-containing protein [Bacillus glycinifermentans]
MKIAKVINNNVVSVLDERDQELVVMGRGIAFQKKPGEMVDESRIEKIFRLDNKDISERFKTLLDEIPIEFMEMTEEIISLAKMRLGKKLNDSIYVSLTDHIHFAIERHKKGMDIKNALLWETKRLYKDEFAIGKEALLMIKNKTGIELPEDEAAFIALHIVNAELNEEMPNIVNITKVMQEILSIVKYHFHVDFDEESLHYYRFITHLKFFAQRLFSGSYMESKDDFLFDTVKNKYRDAYGCTNKIKQYIEKEYGWKLTSEELLYLTIHIERVVHQA